jgi:hypothetical protein
MLDTNHLPLAASNITSGSPIKEDTETLKKSARENVLLANIPFFM